ncbi:MAG: SIMPL domain-containing protein [Rhodospirillaceae bacterium]|jgi:uncharacterized protein|nr:SIMPL domain-containing protein [Rhodospirillaceae bacterium]MBT5455695.1 SIMPL domain-containing protein [Rhodospirillaceae bacterium]
MSRIIAASIAIILLTVSFTARAGDDPKRMVLVEGTGTVTTVPDIADIMTGVTNKAESARQALDANNAAMARLMKALAKADIDEKDIRTSGFTVSPRYEYIKSTRQRRITGYQATNQVTVTVRELKRVGRVIDDVVTAGSNQVQGIQFRVSEPERLLDEARKKAFADAKRRAELYADAADIDLGKVIQIQERSARSPQPRMLAASALKESRAVPVSPGSQRLSVNVSVKFELD